MMYLSHRPYDELSRDFERIWRFLLEDYAFRQDKFVWLFSRFGDWKYGLWGENKFFPSFFRENAHLWFNNLGDLCGLVISESGDETFTIFTRQGYGFLYGDILKWTTTNWQKRGNALKTEIHEFQTPEMACLEKHGFTNRGQVALTRRYNLEIKAVEPSQLKEGFRIVDRLSDANDQSKRLLQRLAFARQDTVRDIDLWAYAYSRECPCYYPQYDLSVITSDGAHVASCVGFADFDNRVAEIERVCTHPGYLRQGLAAELIRACFKRLAADGIKIAYITGYSEEAIRLYGKLGAECEKQWYLYETV